MAVEISNQGKLYSLVEAQELLPIVNKLTQMHSKALQPLQDKLDRMLSNDPRRAVLEREYEQQIDVWRGKVERLGANAVGL